MWKSLSKSRTGAVLTTKDARTGEAGVSSRLDLGMHLDVNCSVAGGLEKSSAPDLKSCFGGELSEAGELQVLPRFGIWIANWRQFFAYPLGLINCSFRHITRWVLSLLVERVAET